MSSMKIYFAIPTIAKNDNRCKDVGGGGVKVLEVKNHTSNWDKYVHFLTMAPRLR